MATLPIVKLKTNAVTRLRLVSGPGHLDKPSDKIFQHWSSPTDLIYKYTKQPWPCAGVQNDCIFHAEPLKFRCAPTVCMNAIVYEDGHRSMQVLNGMAIFNKILAAAYSAGITRDTARDYWNLVDYDLLITKTVTADKQTVSVIISSETIEKEIDLDSLPDIDPAYAHDDNPKFVDYYKFESMKPITAKQQEIWFDGKINGPRKPPEETVKPVPVKALPASNAETIFELKIELEGLIFAMPTLANFGNLRKFYDLVGDGKSPANFSPTDYRMLIALAQDETHVIEAIHG